MRRSGPKLRSGCCPEDSGTAAGGPIAAVQNGDEITIDIPNRTLQLHISDEELAERLRHVKPLIKPRTPSLAKYAALVTSADRGAILEIPDAIDPVRQTI